MNIPGSIPEPERLDLEGGEAMQPEIDLRIERFNKVVDDYCKALDLLCDEIEGLAEDFHKFVEAFEKFNFGDTS